MTAHVNPTTIADAVRAVVTDLGPISPDDIFDTLYGILGGTIVDENEGAIYWHLRQLGVDITLACEGHPTEDYNGPPGITDYCDGTCKAVRPAPPKCGSCGRLVTDGQHPGCYTTNPEPA